MCGGIAITVAQAASGNAFAAAAVCFHIGTFAACFNVLSRCLHDAALAAPSAYALALVCSRLGPGAHFHNCRLWTMFAAVSTILLSVEGLSQPCLAVAGIAACPQRFLWWPPKPNQGAAAAPAVDLRKARARQRGSELAEEAQNGQIANASGHCQTR